ncbi:TetR/AcrR family transcriptional regulator [Streptosporangium lutulentum]|uniref:TetR/AcrR family transcriptional regulator n=1 Tax=Streptosporangium lutulentum TaxID=1461250 RepID=UPI00362E498F
MPKETTPRRRDSAASRERLLSAAGELFADRGFDRTSAREAVERAGVDPTMIARYFGGKAQLFIAVLRTEADIPADLLDPDRLTALLDRMDRHGPGPVIQAGIRPYGDAEAQAAARAELQHRLVAPLRERLAREGDEQADLRAELLVAAFTGVILSRRSGAFEHLSGATADELLPLLRDLLGAGEQRAHEG